LSLRCHPLGWPLPRMNGAVSIAENEESTKLAIKLATNSFFPISHESLTEGKDVLLRNLHGLYGPPVFCGIPVISMLRILAGH